jgi:hypothetical protein
VDDSVRPLQGIRVLDFSQVMMGPVRHPNAGRLRGGCHQDRARGRRLVSHVAALAVSSGVAPRQVRAAMIQKLMRDQRADPGDVPSANAAIDATAFP